MSNENLGEDRSHAYEDRPRDLHDRSLLTADRRIARALRAAEMGEWLLDLRSGLLERTPFVDRLLELSESADRHIDTVLARIHPDDTKPLSDRLMQGDGEWSGDYRIVHRDGSIGWIALRGETERDIAGKPVRAIGLVMDITARKSDEQRMRELLAEQEELSRQKDALLVEVNHRVKNSLQLVSSLLSLQVSEIEDEQARALFKDATNRVRVIGRIHQHLYQVGDRHGLFDFGDFLPMLCADIVAAHGATEAHVRCEAEPVVTSIDLAVPLSMIVNELLMNALKHAFPKGDGHLDVTLAHDRANGRVVLAITDSGAGLPPKVETRGKGLGHRLVRGWVGQIDADLAIERLDPGTRVTVSWRS